MGFRHVDAREWIPGFDDSIRLRTSTLALEVPGEIKSAAGGNETFWAFGRGGG